MLPQLQPHQLQQVQYQQLSSIIACVSDVCYNCGLLDLWVQQLYASQCMCPCALQLTKHANLRQGLPY